LKEIDKEDETREMNGIAKRPRTNRG